MIKEYLLQIFLIAAGLFLFLRTMISLAKKNLTETISMFWCLAAVLLVIAGIMLLPFDWRRYITPGALIFVAVSFIVVISGVFYLSQVLSYNVRKTQELAIQISLLNQEHIKVNYHLSTLSGETRNKLWRTDTVAETSFYEDKKEDAENEEDTVCH